MTIDDMKNDHVAWAHTLYSVLIHHKNTDTLTNRNTHTNRERGEHTLLVSSFCKINKIIKWQELGRE